MCIRDRSSVGVGETEADQSDLMKKLIMVGTSTRLNGVLVEPCQEVEQESYSADLLSAADEDYCELLSAADEDYCELLRAAAETDFSLVKQLEFIHLVQDEALQQPVVVLLLANLKPTSVDNQILLKYLIWMLDTVADSHFSVVLLCQHGGMPNVPALGWLRETPGRLLQKYSANLTALYVIEPSVALRTLMGCLSPFVSDLFWNKIRFLDSSQDFFHRDSKVGHCCQILLSRYE
eukprot:TRINITY_DN8780_c0_g1_i1.p1 TRINITY_DN8780_c0_g1~~TRINITY_DN8780_c0_g1_i1.p1  ORF type:complete len:235 (+),score=34.84 TRINITY_DN8780_c0_g1_i1:72-776(+)